jgi:hypothetical protein
MFSTRTLKQKVMPGGTGGIDSPRPGAYRACGKFEVSTVQVDPFLQGASPAGGDAFRGDVASGIQIPGTQAASRYLLLLARAKFNIGRRVRLVGIRQYASIGATQVNGTPLATTSVAVASNGTVLPLVGGVLNVGSTAGFPAGPSTIIVDTTDGPETLSYTAIGGPTTFTGVNGGSPGVVLFTGNVVDSTAFAPASIYTSFFEKPIVTPRWRFPDGNISWHVMALPPNVPTPAFLGGLPVGATGNVTNQKPGFAFDNTSSPSILSLTGKADGVAYLAPNGGRPFGVPLTPDLGSIHDMRWPWDSANSWHYSLDVPINAPCDICLYASVQQTNTESRNLPSVPPSPVPGSAAAGFGTLTPEDQFLLTFPTTAAYWRVAGALVFAENCCEDCQEQST